MDTSKSDKSSENPIIDIDHNIEATNEPYQEVESFKDYASAQHIEINSEELGQKKTENIDDSTAKNSVEMLNEFGNRGETGILGDEYVPLHKECEEVDQVETATKNTIEILNVELVAPGSDNFLKYVSSATDTISQIKENGKNDLASSKLDIDIEENAKQKHVQNETNLEEIKLNKTDGIDFSTQINDNQNLTNCAENAELFDDNNYLPSPNKGIDMEETSIQKEGQNEPDIEETVMDTTEVPTQANENQNLANFTENNDKIVNASGLSLLAQYQSDDDADSVIEVPITTTQDYRNQVVEIDSDSDSDDSSNSSDVEYLNELRKTIETRIKVADEDDAEDEDNEDNSGKRKPQQRLRVKGEMLLDDLPPIEDLQITVPEDDCTEFGKIHSIVDQLVLVSALANSILLDLETVIFLEKGQKVLGKVFDVLGQVADPLYCVRFNSNKHIMEKEIQVGAIVYVAPKTPYTQYVILSSLMRTKGSDASWENDMEPPPRFLDYSDDEQEQLAKRQQRNKDRPNDNADPSKRSRTKEDDDSESTTSSYQPSPQLKNRYQRRNNRGSPAGNSNVNNRPHYNGPHQSQPRSTNHHRSSWHSNYYPHNYMSQPPNNYRMQAPQYRAQSYNPNMPAFGMPPSHNIQYSPPQAAPYNAPQMFQQNSSHHMPNIFSTRPPTYHGPPPHGSHHQQYTSTPPPPPGSQ